MDEQDGVGRWNKSDHRRWRRLVRPFTLCLAFSVFAELSLFGIGVLLDPSGDLLKRFHEMVIICGIGMGATLGFALDWFVVDRLTHMKAIVMTSALCALVLAIGCVIFWKTVAPASFMEIASRWWH